MANLKRHRWTDKSTNMTDYQPKELTCMKPATCAVQTSGALEQHPLSKSYKDKLGHGMLDDSCSSNDICSPCLAEYFFAWASQWEEIELGTGIVDIGCPPSFEAFPSNSWVSWINFQKTFPGAATSGELSGVSPTRATRLQSSLKAFRR